MHFFRNRFFKEQGTVFSRKLELPGQGIDFYSNDYLGLTENAAFQEKILESIRNNPRSLLGSTGSRLISGNSKVLMDTEAFIAAQHRHEKALLFPTGYMANLALFSTLLRKDQLLICDEFIHRSAIDGCRLAGADRWKFRHNDLQHLEELLQRANRPVFIAVESLYSMDGDMCPLSGIVALARAYGAEILLDEAHAIGVYGWGLAETLGLEDQILGTVVTYGKAFGLHGAAILGSTALQEYIINSGSPFIFSTAMPDAQAESIRMGYEFIAAHPSLQESLQQNVAYFYAQGNFKNPRIKSPIYPHILPDQERLTALKHQLKQAGILAYIIQPPTVPRGTERLRICIHANHQPHELDLLISLLIKYG